MVFRFFFSTSLSIFGILLFLNTHNEDRTLKFFQIPQEIKIDSVFYEATTRGFYESLMITPSKASFTQDRDNKDFSTLPYNAKCWTDIVEGVSKIGIENVENFEPPSKMFQFDGAAMTHLEIYANGNVYRSQTFDKDHPPKELSSIYASIQTIKDSVSKQ